MQWFSFLCFLVASLLCVGVLDFASASSPSSSPSTVAAGDGAELQRALRQAAQFITSSQFDLSEKQINLILNAYPNNPDALQLYGTMILQREGDPQLAVQYFEKALQASSSAEETSHVWPNYLEALRLAGHLEKALRIGADILNSPAKHGIAGQALAAVSLNVGALLVDQGDARRALELFDRCTQLDASQRKCWQKKIEGYLQANMGAVAEQHALLALQHFPEDSRFLYLLGVSLHVQNKVHEALQAYYRAAQIGPHYLNVHSNIAAALQVLGRVDEAESAYRELLPNMMHDAGFLNNYAALLGSMGRKEDEVFWLLRALEIDPMLEQPLLNLASYFQDEGLLDDARELLERYAALPQAKNDDKNTLRLRDALMLSPVSVSWEQMVHERMRLQERLSALVRDLEQRSRSDPKSSLDASFDRIHFYLCYHGLQDREIQELVARAYRRLLLETGVVADSAQNNRLQSSLRLETRSQSQLSLKDHAQQIKENEKQRTGIVPVSLSSPLIRVGFISKFFGVFEPHGLLLDGVMHYLPRSQFRVVCLSVARSDGKPLGSTVRAGCDEIRDVALVFAPAIRMLDALQLDALIFADVLSEPMNHFLSHQRSAPVQIAFWGNPITSGSPEIDYFISSEIMEHPFRTRFSPRDEPYSEQLLLTEGQGIWYFRPLSVEQELAKTNLTGRVAKPAVFSRADWNISASSFVLLLPQSVFKIHPLYDYVLREILREIPSATLVVTGGRRPLWTALYTERLRHVLGPALSARLRVIERVSSESFPALLAVADLVLHPFPFDGSRTAADALLAHKPLLTLPAEQLRGRMGLSLLRTLNLPQLVAQNVNEYVQIAKRLATDKAFYEDVSQSIAVRVDLLWEDMRFPFSLTVFLQRLFSLPTMSYEEFLSSTGRDIESDLQRTRAREENARLFDAVFPREQALLDTNGLVHSEKIIRERERWPRLFQQWRESLSAHERDALPESIDFAFATNATLRGVTLSRTIETHTTPGKDAREEKESRTNTVSAQHSHTNATTTARTSAEELHSRRGVHTANIQASEPQRLEFQLASGLSFSVGPGVAATPSHASQTTQSIQTQTTSRASHTKSETAPKDTNTQSAPQKRTTDTPTSLSHSFQTQIHTDEQSVQHTTSLHKEQSPSDLHRFRAFFRLRDFPVAFSLAQSLFSREEMRANAQFLTELGMLQFLRGEYAEALALCRLAISQTRARSQPVSISQLLCVGVSATYVPTESDAAIAAFVNAHSLLLPLVTDSEGRVRHNMSVKALLETETDTLFDTTLETVEGNLFSAFESARRFDECVEAGEALFSLPLTRPFGAHVIAFALVDWRSPESLAALSTLGESLSAKDSDFPMSFPAALARFREHGEPALNRIIPCYKESSYRSLFTQASQSLLRIVQELETQRTLSAREPGRQLFSESWSVASENIETTSAGVTIVTQFFDPFQKDLPLDKQRMIQRDLHSVLTLNLLNPYVQEICMLLEKDVNFANFPNAHKIKKYLLGRRLTFKDAFLFANEYLQGKTVVLANADIYLDTSVRRLFSLSGKPLLPQRQLLALLKWTDSEGALSIPLRTDSQDIWIFRSPLGGDLHESVEMKTLIARSDFFMGLPRCDNHLAYLFAHSNEAQALNFTVSNPVFHIHGIEIQRSGRPPGSLYSMKDSVQGEGRDLRISEVLGFNDEFFHIV